MATPPVIPFVALLVSAAFGAVSVAWNSRRHETAPLTAIFACTGAWALVDLLAAIEPDPEAARRVLAWSHLPALLLGPATLAMLGLVAGHSSDRTARGVRLAVALAGASGLAVGLQPEAVVAVEAGPWGWMPRFGWPSLVIVPLGMIAPIAGAALALRVRRAPRTNRRQARSARAIVVSVGLSLLAAVSTEYLLPLLGVPAPRLGALVVALASASMWLGTLHASDELAVTPHGLARAMLTELRDGVVLVDSTARIQGCNLRFAEMVERRREGLIGAPLGELVDVSFDALARGVEDRESLLRAAGGATKPVAISSSPARDRRGERVGLVVVFRDRLTVDALRRRLLASGRLAAVGELAAGIAHEVNNPIAFIRSDLNLLATHVRSLREAFTKRRGPRTERRIFDGAALRVGSSLESLDRVAEVVADVKAFAHVGGRAREDSEAAALVESALRLARLLRGEAVGLELAAGATSARVESAQELKQVLFSLLRVLVSECASGGRVVVGLEKAGGRLLVELRAERLEGTAEALRRRFEAIGSGALDAGSEDLGLAISIELLQRLGGRWRARAAGDRALAIELSLPLPEEAEA